MKQRNCLTMWQVEDERVKLRYQDGSILYVTKKDFDRAFGCIINLTKQECERDFAVHDTESANQRHLQYRADTENGDADELAR